MFVCCLYWPENTGSMKFTPFGSVSSVLCEQLNLWTADTVHESTCLYYTFWTLCFELCMLEDAIIHSLSHSFTSSLT